MLDIQIPLPELARNFNNLTQEEKNFIDYFSMIDTDCISPVVNCYGGIGPKGYGSSLVLSRIIKIKEHILSDRQLAKALKQNDLYQFATQDIQPSHKTFNTLRRRLGPKGFIEIHKHFVHKAYRLGLLNPEINELPKNRKKGIIIVADSTFLITSGSTKGQKDEQGKWHFTDESVGFSGKGHHKHKYTVGHKAHSLGTINGVPLVTIISSANESDQAFILTLVEKIISRYPNLKFS